MSRSIMFAILGGVAILIIGVMAVTALFVRSFFTTSGGPTVEATPITILVVATPTPELLLPTAVVTPTDTIPGSTPTDTPAAAPTATSTTAVATPISVVNTAVQYVQARADVNIRSGPGTEYNVIGWVAAGQTASVTGASSDGRWWRVICPNGSSGSCWVTAGTQYTQVANSPVSNRPQPSPTTAPCTNAATFVADVTIPDGSQVAAGTSFRKTWRIQNSGSCTWDGRYFFVHAGGTNLGAVPLVNPLPATVAPGQMVDLSVQMLAPVTPGSYQSDWKLQTPQGAYFGVGRSSSPLWVKITVPSAQPTTVSGLIYQDVNQNGVYDSGEPAVANREVWLAPGTACHVRQDAVATALSGSDGRYVLSGNFNGSYCLGLVGSGGLLDDVVGIALTSGQTLSNINLRALIPSSSISGYLWNDYCLTDENGAPLAGNCVADGNGYYHADGMIQPTEGYIAGAAILLRAGSCSSNAAAPVGAMTDGNGRYSFNNLGPGTYCVLMNAASVENAPLLLPGDWTFPARGIWYHEITLRAGENAAPVNFGWDYQLR